MPSQDDPLSLLAEWMAYWYADDRAPAKLPNGLHVRTAVVLLTQCNWRPDTDAAKRAEAAARAYLARRK